MAEIYGVVASAATIAALADKSLLLTRGIFTASKDAPGNHQLLAKEMETLSYLFKALTDIDEIDSVIRDNIMLQKSLHDSSITLEEIGQILLSLQETSLKNPLLLRMRWMAKRGEIEHIRTRLDRQRSVIQMVLVATTNLQVAKLSQASFSPHYGHNISQSHMEQRQNLLRWISKYDHQAKLLDAEGNRLQGTGDWFRQTKSFRQWEAGEIPVLVLDGPVGCGKTILCSHIIDWLEDELVTHKATAYVFFDSQDRQIQVLQNFLRSIIKQLILNNDIVPRAVIQLWENYGRRERILEPQQLLIVLDEVIKEMEQGRDRERVWVLLDGWDQVEEKNRSDLMPVLSDLCGRSNVSVLITTRPSATFSFETSTFRLSAEVSDLERYIAHQLDSSKRLESRPALREAISERLCTGADGSFLWVSIMLNTILRQRSPKKMRDALDKPPEELNRVYGEELLRIKMMGAESFEQAKIILSILCNASLRVSMEDVQHALAIMQNEDPSDVDALVDQSSLLTSCGFFVISNIDSVTFAHHSMHTFCLHEPELQAQIKSLREMNFGGRLASLFILPEPSPALEAEPDTPFDDGESEIFSQFSTDSTLIDPLREFQGTSIESSSFKPTPISSQIVKILMTDKLLCGLVKVSVDNLGPAGFERSFSILLKEYSLDLQRYARKESQKIASTLIGQYTRRTASHLRSVIQPEDIQDLSQKASILQPNLPAEVRIERWLQQRDGGSTSAPQLPAASEHVNLKSVKLASIANPEIGIENSDNQDDKGLEDVWMNLNSVKVFMLEAPPFLDLRLALTRQLNIDMQIDIAETQRQTRTTLGSFSPSQLMQEMKLKKAIDTTLKWLVPIIWQERDKNPPVPDHHKPGQTIFTWTCRCGETFTDSVLELVPGAAQAWVDAVTAKKEHLPVQDDQSEEEVYLKKQGVSGDGEGLLDQEGPPTQAATESPTGAGPSGPSPGNSQGTHQRRPFDIQWEGNQDNDPTQTSEDSSRQRSKPPRPQTKDLVLLCVNQVDKGPKLVHYDVTSKTKDYDVFVGMKKEYQSQRSSRFILNKIDRVEWRKFQIYLGEHVNIQVAEKEEIPSCDNGTCGVGCRCGCEQHCEGECGNGCYGYRYEPTKAEMIPPIPPTGMIHFLHKPEDLGDSVKNRRLLPKRTHKLADGDITNPVYGWGLHFQETVWQAPIDAVKGVSIVGALLISVLWIILAEQKIHVNNLLPGTFVLGVFQALASWMNEWAERPLNKKLKES